MKTYRAVRHDVVRKKQRENSNECHHPDEKISLIENALGCSRDLAILELFSGRGNLTKVYEKYGRVDCYDKTYQHTGDSYLVFHRLIAEKKIYDVIDLDPYGFPNRFFPDIFMLINKGYLFLTIPKPYVNILNGITKQHLICYFGKANPSFYEIMDRIKLYGLCHWRKVEILAYRDFGRIWRVCLVVEKVKATEYCGVRNQPDKTS